MAIRYIILIALAFLLESKVVAAPLPDGVADYMLLNDTIDEEDLQAMRDTMQMSRRNLAKEGNALNLQDYVVKDTYTPTHHSFAKAWYEHIYVGGSLGIEQFVPRVDDYKYRFLSNISLYVGKQLNRTNSLRLGLGYGWGYEKTDNSYLNRITAKLDYLYNLSTHFQGYNPARPVEISLMAGAGLSFSHLSSDNHGVAPEVHAGLQFKFYTGPLGTINLEPYIGLATDKIDLSGSRNWRRYDIFYGLNLNYSFFLDDNLSDEARLKILQARLADERMINAYTLEKWRTPWFIEYSMGMAMTSSDYLDFSKTMGNQTSVAVGRWLSPAIGFRLMANSRSTKWLEEEHGDTKINTYNFNNNYISANIEALVNPFGFFRNFKWNAPYGAYLTFGYGIGLLRKHTYEGVSNIRSEAYNVGVHLWAGVTDNMQVFIEPRYGRNVYKWHEPGSTAYDFMGDNTFSINAGITMLIRSQKYKNPAEMDDTQNYTYRNIRGFRVGVDFGALILQKEREWFTRNGVMHYSIRPWMEYRFNHLHSVRLMADFLRTNKNIMPEPPTLIRSKTTYLIISPNYQISLTNLLAGRLVGRRLEVEGFIGPSFCIPVKKDDSDRVVYRRLPSMGEWHLSKDDYEKSFTAGANLGFKISYHIWNGISATFTPTIYFLRNYPDYDGFRTLGIGGFKMMQTVSLGVQYKIGKLSRNQEVKRRHQREKDARWKQKQIELIEKQQAKQEAKRAKRAQKRGL